ncbi:MAG TPA: hypothetical protein VIN08_03680 [Ohtaekwangia sp.]|uniref:hypothetical protein n=1 Tax=Ohtaekwangia sp. TaxID=2066019 RepID=UPI002F946E85
MIEYIRQYYLAERSGAMTGIGLGFGFLLLALLLWKLLPLSALTKGLAVGLLVAGSINLVVTISYYIYTSKRIDGLQQLVTQADSTLQQTEIQRMEKVFRSSYPVALLVDAGIILIGIILMMVNNTFFWKGFGLALMILGTVGFIGEGFSMQKNRAYQTAISQLKF